jgi:hypothetical protein
VPSLTSRFNSDFTFNNIHIYIYRTAVRISWLCFLWLS